MKNFVCLWERKVGNSRIRKPHQQRNHLGESATFDLLMAVKMAMFFF
jgi:hypothetical protein